MAKVKDLIAQFAQGAAINSHLTWEDVGSIKQGSKRVSNFFLDGKMVTLPAKTKLYKFNSYPSLRPDAAGNVTPWWSAFDGYDVDPGWYAKVAMAKMFRVSIREFGRVTSAITEGWNSCEYLAIITLKVDIKVAYGRFKSVLRNDGSGNMAVKAGSRDGVAIRDEGRGLTKKLPGGGRQFYIPNLKPDHYTWHDPQSLLAM
jgi:hypothetical protein